MSIQKKRAQKLYRELQGEGVYHLSTSMCPRHRKAVLQKIRQCLDEKKCVVVAMESGGGGSIIFAQCIGSWPEWIL